MISLRQRRSAAFSLMELMFVIVILGILMAVALPRFAGTSRRAALETTARDMSRLAAFARQAAVSSQRETILVFDQEEDRWYYQGPADEDDLRDMRRDRDEPFERNEEEQVRDLHRLITFHEIAPPGGNAYSENEVVRVTFYPNGSSTGAIVVIKNDENRTMTVEIEKSTARAIAYLGEPKSFEDRLEEMGVDPSQFGIEKVETDQDRISVAGEGFSRIGGAEDRQNAYADAAARILGRVSRDAERADVLSGRMQDRIRDMERDRNPVSGRTGRNP